MVSSRSEGKLGPKSRKEVYLGMGLALLGALLWGLSGTCVQFLENQRHVNMEWLVTVRLFVAGCINVAWVLARHHLSDLTKIFSNLGIWVSLSSFPSWVYLSVSTPTLGLSPWPV